ncbi:hypothetical protein RI367_002695 [Sorochytrium milnesiophthora]
MQHIERDQLYTDLLYRFTYVANFVDFGDEDKKLIHDAAEHLAPLVPAVVDSVYKKLFSFDITKKVFVDRMEGFHGKQVSDTGSLKLDSEQIRFRKDMLSRYLVKLVTAEYNEPFVKYLDWVALIHIENANKKSSINVEYIHINALMGYVESILLGAISDLPLDATTKKKTLLAFNKLLWIQNDLFTQYYCRDGQELVNSRARAKGVAGALAAAEKGAPAASGLPLNVTAGLGVVAGVVLGYLAQVLSRRVV